MSLEDASRLITARARLMTSECEGGVGGMKAVFAPQAEVEAAIDKVVATNLRWLIRYRT